MYQPDANDQMLAITEQVSIMLAAASAANWKLAAHAYRAVVKRLNAFMAYREQTKPLQAQLTGEFLERWCPPVLEAIKSEDAAAFRTGFADLIAQANTAHDRAGFGYILVGSSFGRPAWMPDPTDP